MKKTLTLVALLACVLSAAAQDTVAYPFYRYMEYSQYDTNEPHRFWWHMEETWFIGPAYKTDQPQTVYGVALVLSYFPEVPEHQRYGKILQKIDGEDWTMVDSARLFVRPPDRYLKFANTLINCESHSPAFDTVFPVYEAYFDHPIPVVDSFSVGFGYDYSVINHFLPQPYCSDIQYTQICGDTTYNQRVIITQYLPNGGYCFRVCHSNSFPNFFPILMPPDTDSYVCAGVDSVRVQGSGTGWVNVAWAPGSEDQDLFEIAYGVRGEDPERYASVTNLESPRVIFDDAIDTGVYYSARVRARCRHRCAVHDTLVWGPWSDLVHFYVGNHEPNMGIAEANGAAAFALSPNPTAGEVTVTLPPLGEGSVLTVADASGREVRRQPLDPAAAGSRLRLDLNGLPAGTYFVTLVTPQGSHTEKLLIQ